VSSPPTGRVGERRIVTRSFRGALTTFFENRQQRRPASSVLQCRAFREIVRRRNFEQEGFFVLDAALIQVQISHITQKRTFDKMPKL
jgi:hypothetical protein